MSSALLTVKNLSIRFGGLKAVEGVSFEVRSGEIMGLLGPNGAGKTSCFNAISCVYKPTHGEIYLEGRRIDGLSSNKAAKRGIGRTFQVVKPFSGLTVLENVVVPLGVGHLQGNLLRSFAPYGTRRVLDEARAILETVGLEALADRQSGLLPIGNLRRLEIARALALKPRLLLLDESFSGLRYAEIARIEDLVRDIRNRGIAVLLIEHNMNVAMSLCDRIVVLDHGAKLAEGLPREIAKNQAVVDAYLGKDGSGHVA